MKSLFIITVLFSASAWATPRVGDKVVIVEQTVAPPDEENKEERVIETVQQTIEIIERNPENGKLLQRTSLPLPAGHGIGVNEYWADPTEFQSDAQSARELEKCVEHGGQLETVVIQNVNVQTCHRMLNEGTEIWAAPVLTGAVKVIEQLGEGFRRETVVIEFEHKR